MSHSILIVSPAFYKPAPSPPAYGDDRYRKGGICCFDNGQADSIQCDGAFWNDIFEYVPIRGSNLIYHGILILLHIPNDADAIHMPLNDMASKSASGAIARSRFTFPPGRSSFRLVFL